MSNVAHLSSFNPPDPFQRARTPRARPTRRTSRKTPASFATFDSAPRETRSLDLDPRQRLPIGPQSSGTGSRSSTPTQTHSPTRPSLDSFRSRQARAQRRQGSIFNVPVPLNPAVNVSSSSLTSTYSQTPGPGVGNMSAVNSARETKSHDASHTRHRKPNIPAPLDLNGLTTTTRPSRTLKSRPPTPGPSASSTNKQDSPLPSLPSNPKPVRACRRSRSASFFLNASSGSTPLTPSFRFLAPQLPEHREKKLNKLARTLGENIPLSLVFPSASSTSTLASSNKDLSAPTTPVSGHPSVSRRTSDKACRRASKLLLALDLNSFPTTTTPKNPKGISHWEPPSEWSLGPSETKTKVDQSDTNGHRNKEEGTGEDDVLGMWNTDSYDDVLERLRNLKR